MGAHDALCFIFALLKAMRTPLITLHDIAERLEADVQKLQAAKAELQGLVDAEPGIADQLTRSSSLHQAAAGQVAGANDTLESMIQQE